MAAKAPDVTPTPTATPSATATRWAARRGYRPAAPAAASDGNRLLAAAAAATARLAAHAEEVDALNVFPVPDGDTGTNMLATMRAALDEATALPRHARTLRAVADALGRGALMGARGNSGVILSQYVRGIAETVRDAPAVSGPVLADALRRGSDAARAAIGDPVEGTVLTVARDAAAAARGRATATSDLADVLEAAAGDARASVTRSPELLPVLREAGVVDAGGHALALLMAGALASLRGADAAPDDAWIAARPRIDALTARVEQDFGFETTFVLRSRDRALSLPDVRRQLESMGESVVVAGDRDMLRVHVHNSEPDAIVEYGRSIGTVERIVIEDLGRQAHEMCDARAVDVAREAVRADQVATLGLVAVAPGPGLARVLRAAGAVVVEATGREPSADELAAAVRATGAAEVLLIPNGIRAATVRAARQQLVGMDLTVVPTRDAGEGIAAALAIDPSRPQDENARRMLAAARSVRTVAVPSGAGSDAVPVGSGAIAAALDAVAALPPGFELVTVYVGAGVDPAEADELRQRLQAAHAGAEVELVEGGQPHDRYLITVE